LDPDPDPYWPPTSSSGSGSGSVKNEYGSTTLLRRCPQHVHLAQKRKNWRFV
jgi:hypothetical protein